MKRTFIYSDAKSNKFWSIEITSAGKSYTVTYGKVGTAGQTTEKSFPSTDACQKAADKLIAEKTGKGYVEQTTGKASTAPEASSSKKTAKTEPKKKEASPTAKPANPGKFFLIRGDEFLKKHAGLKALVDMGCKLDERLIIACEGDGVFEGELDLNYASGWDGDCGDSQKEFLARFGITPPSGKIGDIAGLAVTGNLHINGKLDDSAEMSAYLYVGGGLFADSVHADNAFIHICGDSEIKTMVHAVYNNGSLTFQRRLTVPVLLIPDDHCTEIGDPNITLYAYEANVDELEENDDGEPTLPRELKAVVKKGVASINDISDEMLDPKKATPEKLTKLKKLMAARRERLRLTSFVAACKDNLELAKYFLANGCDVNDEVVSGNTPLIAAADNAEILRLLLSEGAKVNHETADHQTALIDACVAGNKETVKLLLEAGATPDYETKENKTALLAAAEKGHMDIVDILRAAGANPNRKTKTGDTLLFQLFKNDRFDLLPALLNSGADPASCGWTPLHVAVIKNDTAEASRLMAQTVNSDALDKRNFAPFHHAVLSPDTGMIALLLKAGADKEVKTPAGSTPLYLAALDNKLEALKALDQAGAAIDKPRPDGLTPLLVAAINKHLEVVRYLLSRKANPNAKHKNGDTVLHFAVSSGNLEMVKLVVEAGANINALGDEESTPLYSAVIAKNIEIIRYLLAKGANPNIGGARSCSGPPIFYAADTLESVELTKLLLEAGAKANVKDEFGQSLIKTVKGAIIPKKEIIALIEQALAK